MFSAGKERARSGSVIIAESDYVVEFFPSQSAEQALGHSGPGGIVGAQEQNPRLFHSFDHEKQHEHDDPQKEGDLQGA